MMATSQPRAVRAASWRASRARSAPAIVVAVPGKKALSPGATKLLENLQKSAKNRPKKRSTLVSHAKSSLGKHATDAEGEAVVAELQKAGKLKFNEKGAVEYRV